MAVLIVGFRNTDYVVRCIGALETSTYANYEVVICENGGPPSYAALRARLPAVLPGGQPVRLVLAAGNIGFAGGVNVGFVNSKDSDAWWLLNPDTEVEPDAMSELVARLSVGDCDAVGGTLLLASGLVQSYGGHWSPLAASATSIGHSLDPGLGVDVAAIEQKMNYLSGASTMVNRRFLEIAGLMHEDYFLYCEEVEWFLRAIRGGARLGLAANARVLHYDGTSTGKAKTLAQSPRLPVYLLERNRILLTRDCYPNLIPLTAPIVLLLILARYLRRRAWKPLGYALAGWFAGLRNERGPPAFLKV